jgi:hypothetical protein
MISNINWQDNHIVKVSKVLFGLCLIIYGQTIFYDWFIFDDLFHSQRASQSLSLIVGESKIPIFLLFWKFVDYISNGQAFLFRVVLIFFHAVNSILVYIFAEKIFATKISEEKELKFVSYIVAILFLIHPIQVESVAWISSLKGVLASTFALASLCLYLNSDKKNWKNRLYIWFFFGLSALSKPSYLLLPTVFITLDVMLYGKSIKALFKENLIYILLALFLGFLTILEYPQIFAREEFFRLDKRVLNVFYAISFYIQKSLLPTPLLFDYGITKEFFKTQIKTDAYFYRKTLALGFIFAWPLIGSFFRKTWSISGLGLWIFTIFLIPVLGFIPHNFESISLVADRFMYLSILGLAIVFADLIMVPYRKNARLIYGICIFLGASLLSISTYQAYLWRNTETILRYNLRHNFESIAAMEGLSTYFLKEKKYKEAEEAASTGLKFSDGKTFYFTMIDSLMMRRNYHLLEVFEKSMTEQKRLDDLQVQAYLDFALFRYKNLVAKSNIKINRVEIVKMLKNSGYSENDLADDDAENAKFIDDLISRYPEERDKEIMLSYFAAAEFFRGAGQCDKFLYLKKQMDEYRTKRNYTGSINLDYSARKCVNASGKKS